MHEIRRRSFILSGAAGLTGVCGLAGAVQPAQPSSSDRSAADAFPRTDDAEVAAFVGACHANLERVRAMLAVNPGLAKSAWDWGFGDWETALGAASHTGRRDIITILMAAGARPDVFTFACLDEVRLVRAFLEGAPDARFILGPHDIPLYEHALAGDANRVTGYLESIGVGPNERPVTDAAIAAALVGVYAWGAAENERAEISWNEQRSILVFRQPGHAARNLRPEPATGAHRFRPVGSRETFISFSLENDARLMRIMFNGRTLTARPD